MIIMFEFDLVVVVLFVAGITTFCERLMNYSNIVIQVWDLAKCSTGAEGGLKLTLTGHIHTVRGLAISKRHPYMFSAGEDKKVMLGSCIA